MVEFKETMGKGAQERALVEALNLICKRSQSQFKNPLMVKYWERDLDVWIPGDHPFFYIAEAYKEYLFGIFPRRRHRKLFAIYPGFYGEGSGKKEVCCAIFDDSILYIVKDEIQKYANAFQATSVNLSQNFI